MKTAIIYTRVSTTGQAENGISMDAQLDKAMKWCEINDYPIAGQYQDSGVSGKRADNRPGLQAALDHACAEQAPLVVYSLSRLGRSTKDLIEIAERLNKAGADLVSLSENIDTTSAAGKMVFRMLAVLSEFERDLVSERTRAALAHKRANKYKTGGEVPYGYNVDAAGKLTPNKDEQDNIRYMKELRKKRGLSYGSIAKKLTRVGIPTKTGKGWGGQTVKNILDREE